MPAPAPSDVHSTLLPPAAKRPAGSRWTWAFLIDIAVFLFVCSAVFGIYTIGRTWFGPTHAEAHISQNPRDLPLYAFYSLVRIGIAYAFSLAFALAYGYLAASSRRAEMLMVPLLDILQSIPVLSFLPGVMLAMVALFPHRYALAFAVTDMVIAGAWLTIVAWISDKAGTLLRRPRVRTALDRATGTVLVALGLKVAVEQLA